MIDGFRFTRRQRLTRQRDFERVFEGRCRAADASMVIYVDTNGLSDTRLGMSVSRRVGNAVKRNRIKRLIREAFRLSQHDLPAGLDVVCVVKPADALRVDDYRESLVRLIESAHRKLNRRPESKSPNNGIAP